jgi:histidinol dehydrogenase
MTVVLPEITYEAALQRAGRADPVGAEALTQARSILDDLARDGDAAALHHAIRLGDLRRGAPVFFDRDALAAAREALPASSRHVIERTVDRVRTFAEAQRRCIVPLDTVVDGGRAGHTLMPVTTAGCYVPGGRFPLVSSAIMTIATARAAGVERVVAASPRPTVETLAAAAIAGADALLAMGGAQAIGALAKGLCRMPHCDVIVGPGNQWVTAAKFLVSAQVGIDMLAGPSELLIVADSTADPVLIAADLLAQAEHDVDARACLIVQTPEFIEAVRREIRVQLARLPLADTARVALERSFVVAVRDREAACALIDALAPEHLELMTSDAADLARTVRNAGAIFLGSWSPEALGDYGLGPNHVLPTGGTARARGGLSVFTFLRARTWLHLERPGREAWLDAVNLARIERLEAHARSIEARLVNSANLE